MAVKASDTIRSGVEEVKRNPVIVTQGRAPVQPVRTNVNTNTAQASVAPSGSGTPPTGSASGDTTGSASDSDSGTNNVASPADQTQTQTQAPQPAQAEINDEDIKNILNVEDAGKQEEAIEDYAKKNGLEVSEVRRQVDKAKVTSDTSRPSSTDGRENAGNFKGLMDNPDWGRPLDDKFDIQQGDFIEFLMKDVVLASAAWTGNKVFGVTGYVIYKVGSETYKKVNEKRKKWLEKYKEDCEKSRKKREASQRKINNENLYSGALTQNDDTNAFAKKVLDIRKSFLDNIEKSDEIKNAQALCTYVRSVIRGEIDFNSAERKKNGKWIVTRNYKDDQNKECSQKITFDENVYKILDQVNQNVQKTINNNGDSQEIRQDMEADISARFEKRAALLEKEKIFAADYAASVLIEKAARLDSDEIKKLKTEKEFQNLVNGEGKLTFYHHLYDIEHRKPEAFKSEIQKTSDGEVKKSALEVLSDTGHAALEESVKKLNNSQYQEAYMKQGLPEGTQKEPPLNDKLNRIFIKGESEYAPELNKMTEPQREESLKFMQQDAANGYIRLEQLTKQQQNIDAEISAVAADDKNHEQKKQNLEAKKKTNINDYDSKTQQRDQMRSAAFAQIRGNTK